jgi:hypothetical protein
MAAYILMTALFSATAVFGGGSALTTAAAATADRHSCQRLVVDHRF